MTTTSKFRDRFISIADRAADLEKRITENGTTSRDLAELVELFQMTDDTYAEIQDAFLEGRLKHNETVTVSVEGTTLKFKNIDDVAEWLANG